jgi:hypothetical protein
MTGISNINRYFADADRAIGEVKYSRIEAGKLLIEAILRASSPMTSLGRSAR